MFPRFAIEIFCIILLILFVYLSIKLFKSEEPLSFYIDTKDQSTEYKVPRPTLTDIIP